MLVIRFTRRLGAIIAASCALAILPHAGHAYSGDQQQACTGDAFRLCSSEIPDVDRITACMIRNKSQLSPECRAFFRPGPEPERASVELKPAVSRKARRPHHIKKSRPSAT
jgi:hypothetical protein